MFALVKETSPVTNQGIKPTELLHAFLDSKRRLMFESGDLTPG
jgi:hypothetical protein